MNDSSNSHPPHLSPLHLLPTHSSSPSVLTSCNEKTKLKAGCPTYRLDDLVQAVGDLMKAKHLLSLLSHLLSNGSSALVCCQPIW